MMQSSGGVSLSLKTYLFIFWKFFSYNCWYFDMAFLICVREYSVVILRASFSVIFALLAKPSLYILCGRGWVGGGWQDIVSMINDFLDNGVVSPVGVVFRDVYYFPNKVIGGEVFFPLFLKIFWKIATMFSDYVW